MKSFGGNWTEKKLNAFIKYVIAYLKILNNAKAKFNWQTIYFDGFAGLRVMGKGEIILETKILSLKYLKM